MFFIIFKLPRTGSTSLVHTLNAVEGVTCIAEILNEWDRRTALQKHIEVTIGRYATETTRVAGFTLNPLKHRLHMLAFDPTQQVERYHGLKLYYLFRKDVFKHALSLWVSKALANWSTDRVASTASDIDRFVSSYPTIPVDAFARTFRELRLQDIQLWKFVQTYAAQYSAEAKCISYEGLYSNGCSDFTTLWRDLGLTGAPQVDISKKLLPDPQMWVANYHKLVAACGTDLVFSPE